MSSPQITRRAKTPTSRSRSASESDLDSLAPERSQQDLEQDARNIVLRKLNYAPRTRSELATDLLAGASPNPSVSKYWIAMPRWVLLMMRHSPNFG